MALDPNKYKLDGDKLQKYKLNQEPEEKDGFFKSVVKSIAKPVISTVAAPIQAVVSAKQYMKDPLKEADVDFSLPYLGKFEPPKTVKEQIGRSAQTVALGLGPAAGGATFGAGSAIEQDKDLKGIAVDTTLGYFGGKYGAKALDKFGGALSKTVPAAHHVGDYIVDRFPKLLGILTGEGDDVIRAAMKNPKAADAGIKAGDDALRKVIKVAQDKSVALKDDFIRAHGEAFKKLAGDSTKKLVNKKEVVDTFRGILQGAKVKVGPGGSLDFTTSKIKANPGEIAKINDAYQAILRWNDYTLGGMNELKQLVGAFTRFADDAGVPSKSPTLGRMYGKVNEMITSNLNKNQRQAYLKMNQKFTDSIDLFDDMVDAFNKGDAFSKIAQVFGKNKDTLRQVIEFYEKQSGNAVSPVVAGRELAMDKAAAFGFMNPRSWIDFLISPKVQAKIVTGAGKMKAPTVPGYVSKPANKIGGIMNTALTKTGEAMKAIPKALDEVPKKNIPGTPKWDLMNKAKDMNIGLSVKNVGKLPKEIKDTAYNTAIELGEQIDDIISDTMNNVELPDDYGAMGDIYNEVRKYINHMYSGKKGIPKVSAEAEDVAQSVLDQIDEMIPDVLNTMDVEDAHAYQLHDEIYKQLGQYFTPKKVKSPPTKKK